jgi:hypothetical protein
VFDFLESAYGRTYDRRHWSGAGWSLTSRAAADSARRILTRAITIRRTIADGTRLTREVHRVAILERADIRQMLRASGLKVAFRRRLGAVRFLPGTALAICRKTPA